MLTSKEKYNHALALRRAITAKKAAEKIIGEMTDILSAYVTETGDKDFAWSSGLSLTYVRGTPAKETVDAKTFMTLAKEKLSADDYAECIAGATKMGSPRKASFR